MAGRTRLLVLTTLAGLLLVSGIASAQIPVQIINSSPDPALAFVDVYVDGTKVADDLAFKAATPFVDEFNNPVTIIGPTSTIVVADQASVDDSSPLVSSTVLLIMGQATLVEIMGYEVPGNFDPNPDAISTALQIKTFEGYKPLADNPATAELMAVHASPNMGTVDLIVRTVYNNPGVGIPLFTGLQYGDCLNYLVLNPVVAALDLVEAGTSNVIDSWGATLGLIQGAAAVGHLGGTLVQPGNTGLTLFGAVASGFVFELASHSQTSAPILPSEVSLGKNYPNPFNPTTTIPFTLHSAQHVTLKVFDVQGRLVSTLEDRQLEEGDYTYTFQPVDMASGMYFYELRTPHEVRGDRMLLVK